MTHQYPQKGTVEDRTRFFVGQFSHPSPMFTMFHRSSERVFTSGNQFAKIITCGGLNIFTPPHILKRTLIRLLVVRLRYKKLLL